VTLVTIWLVAGSNSSERVKGSKAKTEGVLELVVAGMVVVSLYVLSPVQKLGEFFANPNSYSSQIRDQFETLLEQAKQAGIAPGDKVWIIAQHTSGFEYWVIRYSLMENKANSGFWSIGSRSDESDVWTAEKTDAEWAEELKGYDYVLIFKSTESFASEFRRLFEEPQEVSAGRVFKVIDKGTSVSLKRAG